MEGEHALLARLLYGTGMRLVEALWLRVKDVDFAHRTLIVREGKANTDRTLMLPQALEDGLRPVGLCPFPSAAGSCRPLPGRGTAGGAGAQVSARRRGMGLALGIPAGHAEPRSALGRPAAGITGSIRPSSGRSSGQQSPRGPCRQASAVGRADFQPGRAQAAAPRGAASAMVPIGRPAPDPRGPEKAGVGSPKVAGEAPQASPTPGEGKARPA